MEKPTAQLHWVQADDTSVVLTGGAVQTGKYVRLRAEWQPSASYMGPGEFRIREDDPVLSRLRRNLGSRSRRIPGLPADAGGPPLTHSRDRWLATASAVTRQSRYIFTDAGRQNTSGTLTVSAVAQYTTQPHFEASGTVNALAPIGHAGVSLSGGGGKIVHHVGATADPTVRVVIMVPWGEGEADLLDHARKLLGRRRYLKVPHRPFELERCDSDMPPMLHQRHWTADTRSGLAELLPSTLVELSGGFLSPEPDPWVPIFEENHPRTFDIDESHGVDVHIVPAEPAPEGITFRTAYALRVVDAVDPESYVISEIVEVEGDGRGKITLRA